MIWALKHTSATSAYSIGLCQVYFFQPVSGFGPYFLARFGQKMFLFGSSSGQNYYYSGQFRVQSIKGDLIFLGLIIQEIKFCPHFHVFAYVFPHFYWVGVARVKNISPWVTSGSQKRDPVRFGFLKTWELWVKFRVGPPKKRLGRVLGLARGPVHH